LKLRMHADQLTNSGGAALAAELRAVTADHLEQTEEDGIAAMKSAGVQPVLLPGSVYALGKTRYPKARAMIDAGLAVVLATDFNPGSSPTPSIPMVLSLAATQMKMTPAEGITAATINAAYSLGRRQISSLEAGKSRTSVSAAAQIIARSPTGLACRKLNRLRSRNVLFENAVGRARGRWQASLRTLSPPVAGFE
jgi:imidazolonepropionase